MQGIVCVPGPMLPSARTAPRAHARIIRDLRDLDALARSWDSLASAGGSPTQHFIWSRIGAEAFGRAGPLHVVAVGHGEQLAAIAPLIKRRGFISRLESIGVCELYEPMDFVYSDASSLAALADELAGQGVPLLLRRLPADSPVIAAVQAAYERRGWVYVKPVDPYPYIELDAGWTEPESHFNSGRRSDLRRAERHGSRIGQMSYEILSPTPSETGSLLNEALQVELTSWRGSTGSALMLDSVREMFFRRYAIAASERGLLRLAFMRIDGKAVGMQIAIECGGRFWLLKIGHNEEYSKCSPGTLLMLQSVKYAAARGLRSYEFLGTAEPWTKIWTENLRGCVALRAYPFRPGGVAASAWDAGRAALSRLKRKVRGQREPVLA
jgi:CelD/BcsL family acetyltransferase involved in cellulose biosynthesis